jgi:polyphenol oxidase
LNISYPQLVGVHQIHSAKVKFVDGSVLKWEKSTREAALEGYDALICNTPGICIAATTADCVPVLLFDPVTKSIAAIHSGWRGTLNNIVARTIEALRARFSILPENIVATVGPCIGGSVYEVGPELKEQFHLKGFDTSKPFIPKENDKYLFDIRSVVKAQLNATGIRNIEVSSHCTYSEPDLFFSARRQGIHSGRMLSGIMLR